MFQLRSLRTTVARKRKPSRHRRRLGSFATLSTGEIVENPRWFETMQKRLRRAQRKLSRRKKYSKRWGKAAQYVVQIHRDIANRRRDFQHKLSREIVNAKGFIAVEDLNINGLASGMLAKSVADVGWSSFLNMLSYKAESAGRQLVRVDPRGTSQRCPCGKPAPKKLLDRKHACECGLQTTRDHASSLEILRLGLSLQAPTKPEVRYAQLEKPPRSRDGVRHLIQSSEITLL